MPGAKPHVLMLVENLSVPTDPRVWREACTLRDAGFQVCVICPRGETRDLEAYACIDDIHIYRYRLPAVASSSFAYIREYTLAMLKTFLISIRVWLRHGIDVVHAANPPDTFFALGLFYRFFGKKYIFDQHDLAPEIFRLRFHGRMRSLYGLMLFFERCSYRLAHVVITTNGSQREMAIKRGGKLPDRVFVVRNGPDIDRFSHPQLELALTSARRYLLAYVGVMGAQDGVDYALRALHELVYKKGRQDVSMVLMGDGDQLPALKALAHELALDDYVHFTGWIAFTDLLRYLAVTDIGISPDPSNELNDQSTMLKTMEYMAMGIPVVAFDMPETRFSAQEAALYAPPNEVAAFADCIEILLNDEQLRHAMGAFGRRRIQEELSWDKTKIHLLYAYNTLFPGTTMPHEDSQSNPVVPASKAIHRAMTSHRPMGSPKSH